jgi:hypothetical protein
MCRSTFISSSGKPVELWARGDGLYVTANVNGEKIGRIELDVIETDTWPHQKVMKLCMMEVSPLLLRRQGISRAMLKLALETSGLPVVATCPHNNEVFSDDSHLVGAGRSFVAAMRNEGLIMQGCFGPCYC